MDIIFKIIGILFILFLVRFLYNIFNESGISVNFNKIKKNYNSLEEFLDFYFVNYNENEKSEIYKNHFQDYEYCSSCKEEKESIKSEMIENHLNKLNEHIIVEYYRTGDKSWRSLCGREGYTFKCTKHNIVVHNIITCMN